MFIFTESDICDDQNNLQKATEFSVWAAQETVRTLVVEFANNVRTVRTYEQYTTS